MVEIIEKDLRNYYTLNCSGMVFYEQPIIRRKATKSGFSKTNVRDV
jgi:4-hydroxyphenylpyruvate dioxygenase-like putative hemolysin